jgi:hypothetical protein
MRRTMMLWEVFVTRFQEAFEQYEKRRLTGEEAGELLGMSGRNFRRLCARYEEDGVEGLCDRRIGKVSPRRAPERELAALGRDLDLIVTLDDATGAIYSAFLIDQEGTMSSFLGLAETIGRHGLFSAFYTDRGGHYFITPKDAGKVDKTQLTQVGRALSQLGITHIPSYSPQARGRMERVFGTLQKRLPQELRLAKIKTMAAANRFLQERFVPDYNARFAVPAAEPGSAFVPYVGRPIEDVLCVQEDRVVGADNCVAWHRRSLQIPPQRHRHHYVRATVRVHQYPDGRLAIFDGPRCLARFDPKGRTDDVVSQVA